MLAQRVERAAARKALVRRCDKRGTKPLGAYAMKIDAWVGLIAAAAAVGSSGAVWAQCRAASGEHQVAVFELYTSEGCDSCPPADRWFSDLGRSADPTKVVALAFHVDYWDRLGWRDRFGSSAYTARQREQASRHSSPLVYTPQVLLQGEDFAVWRGRGQPAQMVSAINTRPARATIELVATPFERTAASIDVKVRVPDPTDRANAAIALALVQDGLASDVKAGENAGKRLTHDRVVRQWRTDTVRFGTEGEASERIQFSLPPDPGPLSLVALVEDEATGKVLQALSLALCAR